MDEAVLLQDADARRIHFLDEQREEVHARGQLQVLFSLLEVFDGLLSGGAPGIAYRVLGQQGASVRDLKRRLDVLTAACVQRSKH